MYICTLVIHQYSIMPIRYNIDNFIAYIADTDTETDSGVEKFATTKAALYSLLIERLNHVAPNGATFLVGWSFSVFIGPKKHHRGLSNTLDQYQFLEKCSYQQRFDTNPICQWNTNVLYTFVFAYL